MPAAGETENAGTPVWKIVVIVVFIAIPLLSFLAQRAISHRVVGVPPPLGVA